MARSAQSIDLGLEGAKEVVYFTHDYYTMSSDKNSHLIAAARLTKKHGVKNFVAVCPMEQDLAWSEDPKNFYEKVVESEQSAIETNPSMTLLRSNLAFGGQSHLIHFLAQCALVGKCPYKNLLAGEKEHMWAPIHTSDIASAVGSALQGSAHGKYTLGGNEKMNLRQIMDAVETAADRSVGSTRGPLIPAFDYLWDFFYGTGADLNMSRLVEFYEKNNVSEYPKWTATSAEHDFSLEKIVEEDYAHPTMVSYKLTHTD